LKIKLLVSDEWIKWLSRGNYAVNGVYQFTHDGTDDGFGG
jgi:hypothetical protein